MWPVTVKPHKYCKYMYSLKAVAHMLHTNQTWTNFFFWGFLFMSHFHALPHMHQALTDFMGHIFPVQFVF